MHIQSFSKLLVGVSVLLLAACGGGDPVPEVPAAAAELEAHAQLLGVSDAQRIAAATATAGSSSNACAAVRPFYWEVGNVSSKLASGSVQAPGNSMQYTATQPIAVASASKWIYGSYVAERQNGVLSDSDRKFLSMRAGYVSFSTCTLTQTIDSCLGSLSNGVYTPSADGVFWYEGGHMQKHASLLGLGALNSRALGLEVQRLIGSDVGLFYAQPQPAAGLVMSSDAYARVLRRMLGGQLKIGALLGSGAVCTNLLTCPLGSTLVSPVPPSESWHYSVGHWVEDDPVVGDGAFSSPGWLGFYPWIDASKSYYGVLARSVQDGGFPSVQCGRLIRKAWLSGSAS
jgi:hypothetical protein